MKKQIEISCEGSIGLRSITEQDIELLRCWRNQDTIRPFFVHQDIISKEQQQRWFDSYVQADDDLMFLIIEKEPACRPIGAAALYRISPEHGSAEFGRLMIGEPAASGKGYGEQTVRLLCRYAFLELGLKKVYLEVIETNTRARRIYEKCGFTHVAAVNDKGLKLIQMALLNHIP